MTGGPPAGDFYSILLLKKAYCKGNDTKNMEKKFFSSPTRGGYPPPVTVSVRAHHSAGNAGCPTR